MFGCPRWVIPNSWANSVTGRSPARSSSRISRRCGSAIALKTSDVVAARAMDSSYSDMGMRQAGEDRAGLVRQRSWPLSAAADTERRQAPAFGATGLTRTETVTLPVRTNE